MSHENLAASQRQGRQKRTARRAAKRIGQRSDPARVRLRTVKPATPKVRRERSSQPIIDPRNPLETARLFIGQQHMVAGNRALQHQNGVFYRYDEKVSAYHDLDAASVRAAVYMFLEHCQVKVVDKNTKETVVVRFKPNKAEVDRVLDALRAVCNLPMSQAAPCWLANDQGLKPIDMLASRSGLLHVPTRTLHPATPNFFTLNGLDLAYNPKAPEPSKWLKFLREVWPDDDESIDALQDMFGYYLTPDTSFQKIHAIVGPKRSGKGTIARTLRRLVGTRNTCSPTLASFGRDFGRQGLIGKTLAVIADARIGRRTDTAIVAETLLSVSGEDDQSIERKFLPDWNGKLGVRFLMLSNELPNINDVSGALVSRFVVLITRQSFYGKEDRGLFNRLVPELPGILNWSLAGRDRVYARGHFREPKSAEQTVAAFNDLSSPEAAFLRECCERGIGEVSQKTLFHAWCQWCHDNGIEHAGTIQTFGRSVRAVLSGITDTRHRTRDGEQRYWVGLRLKEGESQ